MTPSLNLLSHLAPRVPPTAGHALLGPLRREAHVEVASAFAERAAQAATDDPERFGALAEEALVSMRARVDGAAAAQGGAREVLSRLDQLWRDTDAVEKMDDPALPEAERTRIIDALDRFNVESGGYTTFYQALRPMLRPGARIVDLCAGHGGFARAILREARAEGLDLHVTATDLRAEYLERGAAEARAEGLLLHTAPQDALDLSNLVEDPPDVILCTQALHHFSPAMVARMFDGSARIARRGVVFIDGCRNMTHVPFLALLGTLAFGCPGFVHDGVISLRKFFALEELELLCGLVPRSGQLDATWIAPSHAMVSWQR